MDENLEIPPSSTINTPESFVKKDEECKIIKPQPTKLLIGLQAGLASIFASLFFSQISVVGGVATAALLGPIAGVLIGGVILLLVPVIIFFIAYYFIKKNYDATLYKFYSDRIEYYEGFLVKNRKTIHYNRISNIGQQTGIIEGYFKLGTVFIDTAGYSPKGHELAMHFLKNPDQVYDFISQTISKAGK